MWQVIGYRRLQAVSIALLAALITACVVFAPLYQRAMLQALTSIELDQAGVAATGLQVSAIPPVSADGSDVQADSPALLVALVPAGLRRSFLAPIEQQQAQAEFTPSADLASGSGPLLWRAGFCAHVHIEVGRCPRQAGEIAISTADTRTFRIGLGSTLSVGGDPDAGGPTHPLRLRVVGTYRQLRSAYWFGQALTGSSGLVPDPAASVMLHDAFLTTRSTFTSPVTPDLKQPRNEVDFLLDAAHTRVDDLDRLGPAVTRLSTRVSRSTNLGSVASRSGLADIDYRVDHQGRQAQITVFLLVVPLALLALVALALVLGAATEQRRPEVAVAVLRGRGKRGARALLLRELLPVALVGVLLGLAVALILDRVARATLLPGSVGFAPGPDPVLAALVAVLTVTLFVGLAVGRVTREPVERLLRRVPVRRTGWSLGALEAVLLAGAVTVVVAFFAGALRGPVALAAPVLLAVVVGLLLSHATAPVATFVGRRLLARGRVAPGIGLLDAARTPATRRTISVVTVAAAVLVFSLTAVSVGDRNREAASQQQAGAPARVTVLSQDLAGVRAAIAEVDPTGRTLTPVVIVQPPGEGAPATLAVEPKAFAQIALFGKDRLDPDLLAAPRAAPIRLRGDRLSLAVTDQDLRAGRPGQGAKLELDLADPAGETSQIPLGDLARGTPSGPRTVTATVPCSNGCYLTGVTVVTSVGARIAGTLVLSDLRSTDTARTGGQKTPIALGPTSAWRTVSVAGIDQIVPQAPTDDRLMLTVATDGSARTTLQQSWIPARVPTVVAGRSATGSSRSTTVSGVDGVDRSAVVAGRVPRVPGAGPSTRLVNLDVVRRATRVDVADQVEVWSQRENPALLRRLRAALDQRDLGVGGTLLLSRTQRGYDETTAAWSLELGVVVGVGGLLIGLLVMLILAANTWRSRARDLAALRMSGLTGGALRTVATLAQLPAVLIAVVAGTVCGALGAHLALPSVPLFPSAPLVSTLDLSLPWAVILTSAGIALVVMLAAGWLVGTAIARRGDLARVRDSL